MRIAVFIIFTLVQVAHAQSIDEHFTYLLQKYVTPQGEVDYNGLKEQKVVLQGYIKLLAKNFPAQGSVNEQKAYWINTYNAYTLLAVVNNYPIASIKDIKPAGAANIWELKWIEVEGRKWSLNEVENDILRKKFNDPRIHFAINCASVSCPVLRNEAYTAQKLDKQLDEQARRFVNDGTRNEIGKNSVALSQLFSWYAADFAPLGSLLDFVNKYSAVPISKNAEISYLPYNWALNEAN
ncbi:DUF547 domain-containing protein [bacterium]|nr:DUF547 domain-containing protein [bacterium]